MFRARQVAGIDGELARVSVAFRKLSLKASRDLIPDSRFAHDVQHEFNGPPHHHGMSTRFPAMVVLAAALFVNAGAVGARNTAPPPPRQHSHPQTMTLEHAVEQVQRQTKGRILAADSIPSGRNKLYRIKVLTPDGHVRVMQLRSNEGMLDKDRKKDGSGGS